MIKTFLHSTLLLLQIFIFYSQNVGSNILLTTSSSIIIVLISSLYTHSFVVNKTVLKHKTFTNSFIFLILLLIVNIQIPVDFVLSNSNLEYSNYFYSIDQIGILTSFSSSLIVAYNLGCTIACYRINPVTEQIKKTNRAHLRSKPMLYLCLLFFILFVVFINPMYIANGHGQVEAGDLSLSFWGLYIRFSILYIGVIYYKYSNRGLKQILFKISPWFYFSTLAATLLFLFAHNRAYVIFLLSPFIFLFFKITNRNLKFIPFLFCIVVIGVVSISFKIFGVDSLIANPLDNLTMLSNLEGYEMFNSISPFTAELASSIFASSILLHLYYDTGYFLWGVSLLIGVLKILPGSVSAFMMLSGLSVIDFDSGIFITNYMGYSYGLGTNVLGESLVNLGFPLSVILFVSIGYIFTRYDLKIYSSELPKLEHIIVWLSISSAVVFLPRGAISDMIGIVLGNYLVIKLYAKFSFNK